jgi:transketolase
LAGGLVNLRKEIINELLPYFRSDDRYHLLVGDMGFGAIDKLREEFPGRFTNAGIMEQGMVGIAAGMSMSGLIPIVYSITNFLVFRALEQIRNDVSLQGINVKFIGTGANDYFGFLGRSHCCGEDDITLMELVGVKCYDPCLTERPLPYVVKDWIMSYKAGYLRV